MPKTSNLQSSNSRACENESVNHAKSLFYFNKSLYNSSIYRETSLLWNNKERLQTYWMLQQHRMNSFDALWCYTLDGAVVMWQYTSVSVCVCDAFHVSGYKALLRSTWNIWGHIYNMSAVLQPSAHQQHRG